MLRISGRVAARGRVAGGQAAAPVAAAHIATASLQLAHANTALRRHWSALSSTHCAACTHASSSSAASVRSFSSTAAASSSSADSAAPAPRAADEAEEDEDEDEDEVALGRFEEDVLNEEEEALLNEEMERQQAEEEQEFEAAAGAAQANADPDAAAVPDSTAVAPLFVSDATVAAASLPPPTASVVASAASASVASSGSGSGSSVVERSHHVPLAQYTRSVSQMGLALMSRYPIVALRGLDLRLEPDWQKMRNQAQQLLEKLIAEITTDTLAPSNRLSWESTREILLLCKNFQLYSHALTVWKRIIRPQSDEDLKRFYAAKEAEAAAAANAAASAVIDTATASPSSSSVPSTPASASASSTPATRPLPERLLVPRKVVHMILECATKSLGPEGGHALLQELDSLEFAERSCLTSRAWSLILKGYADRHLEHAPSQRSKHLQFLKKYYDAIPDKDEWVHGMMLDIYLEWGETEIAQQFMQALLSRGQQLGPATISAMMKDVRQRMEATLRMAGSVDKRGNVKRGAKLHQHPAVLAHIAEVEHLWTQAKQPGTMQASLISSTLFFFNLVLDVPRMLEIIQEALALEKRDTKPPRLAVYMRANSYVLLFQAMMQTGEPEKYTKEAAAAYANAQQRYADAVASRRRLASGELRFDHRLHSTYFQFLQATGQAAIPTVMAAWVATPPANKTLDAFQTVLSQLGAIGAHAEADKVVAEFESHPANMEWNIDLINLWISCYERQGQWRGAEAVWQKMLRLGLAPNSRSYSNMFRVLMSTGAPEQLAKIDSLYDDMLSGKGPAGASLTMTPFDFDRLIESARDCRLAAQASEWGSRARTSGSWLQLKPHSRAVVANVSRWSTKDDKPWEEITNSARAPKITDSRTASPAWLRSGSIVIGDKSNSNSSNNTTSSSGLTAHEMDLARVRGPLQRRHHILTRLDALRAAIDTQEKETVATGKQMAVVLQLKRQEVDKLLTDFFALLSVNPAGEQMQRWEFEALLSRIHQAECYHHTKQLYELLRFQQTVAWDRAKANEIAVAAVTEPPTPTTPTQEAEVVAQATPSTTTSETETNHLVQAGDSTAAATAPVPEVVVPRDFELTMAPAYTSLLLNCLIHSSPAEGAEMAASLLAEFERPPLNILFELDTSAYSVVLHALIRPYSALLSPSSSSQSSSSSSSSGPNNDNLALSQSLSDPLHPDSVFLERVLRFYDSITIPKDDSIYSAILPLLLKFDQRARVERVRAEMEARGTSGLGTSNSSNNALSGSETAASNSGGKTDENDDTAVPDVSVIIMYVKSLHLELQYILDTDPTRSAGDCVRLTRRAEEVWARCKQLRIVTPLMVLAMMKLYALVSGVTRIKGILKEALLLERAHAKEAEAEAGAAPGTSTPPVYVCGLCFAQLFRSFADKVDGTPSEHIKAASHAFDLMLRRHSEAAAIAERPGATPAQIRRAVLLRVDGVSIKSYLKFLRASGQGAHLVGMWQRMTRQQKLQTPFAFVAVLNHLAASGDVAAVEREAAAHDREGLPWDVLSCTSAMTVYKETGDGAAAERVWDRLHALGYAPDEGMYCALMQVYMSSDPQRLARVDTLYRSMKRAGLTFRVAEFVHLIRCALAKGLHGEAIRWGERCNQAGLAQQLDPSIKTSLQALLRTHVRQGARTKGV